jgi:dephospho-CoA kinase
MSALNPKWISKDPTTRLYHLDVPIIGLTGGIATGKSTVANLFRKAGIAVIDADQLVKSIYQRPEAHEFVQSHFPNTYVDGKIDFKKLREMVFSFPTVKQQVETFIYSLLPEEFLKTYNALGKQDYIVYDVPLLFEKGLDQLVDLSVCIYLPEDVQIDRLMERDQIEKGLAIKILRNQMSISEKRDRANISIDNSGSLNDLENYFKELIEVLTERA